MSQNCKRCQQPLPDSLSDGTCPSCGFAVGKTGETPQNSKTPRDRDEAFEIDSDPHATASHVPTTVREEPIYRKPLPFYPDIPNHTDFEVIGRGGMGTVYRAIQRPTDRTVAIKVVNHFMADSQMRERYINEVRAHARVHHPGIVPIFEVGDCSHGPYFTMEYQPGGTLAQRLKATKFDDREAARIVAEAAEAVHAAHLEGIVHRDIKPSNILVDDAGRVRVTDFGLAKHASGDDITQQGVIVGTFAYMSPEQAAGDPSKIGTPADIYCLGSTLFQLLTGRTAHPTKGTDLATLKQIVNGPSPSVRSFRRDLCPTLDAIVGKSMAHEPAERYAAAADFARDLRHWVAGEPTEAKPLTRGQKVRRFLYRHRAAVALAVVIPFLAVAALALMREMEPPRRLERELTVIKDNGGVIDLLDDRGRPKIGERWIAGESILNDIAGDRGVGFQTQTLSLLKLVEDPMMDRFEIRAEIRHFSRAESQQSFVGLFIGKDQTLASNGETIHRWLAFHFSDFITTTADDAKRERLTANHAAHIDMNFRVRDTLGWSPIGLDRSMSAIRFTPTNRLATGNDWRELRIRAMGDRYEFHLSDKTEPIKPSIVPIGRFDYYLDPNYNLKTTLPVSRGELNLLPYSPRGAIGIIANRSTIEFRKVTIQRID